MSGQAARGPGGDVLPRPVHLADAGWLWIRPLQWGSLIRLYDHAPRTRSADWYAALFRTALLGAEDCSAAVVGELPAGRCRRIEYAILAASGLRDRLEDDAVPETPDPDPVDDADEDERPNLFAPPEESDALADAALDEHRECDQLYSLHEQGYTFAAIYQLLIPELDTLAEGAKRESKRRERERDREQHGESGDAPAQGNRGGSHASDLW